MQGKSVVLAGSCKLSVKILQQIRDLRAAHQWLIRIKPTSITMDEGKSPRTKHYVAVEEIFNIILNGKQTIDSKHLKQMLDVLFKSHTTRGIKSLDTLDSLKDYSKFPMANHMSNETLTFA